VVGGGLLKKLLSDGEFCENGKIENRTVLRGIKELLSDFPIRMKIRQKRLVRTAVD